MKWVSAIQDDRGTRLIAFLALFVVAGAIRLAAMDRQGLWADEVFSLAMATGHSLEQPASKAQPKLGDYVEASQALPASAYKRYLEHQHPPVGPAQVVRAVRLSDTSPPLYYLLLWIWTQVAGTSDVGLRSLSVFWALACFPLLYVLAYEIGGRAATLPALALFALSPLSIYYSTEGRMYSLLWFLAAGLAWLTLKLNQRGRNTVLLVLWVLLGAAGMLTHYFYAFIMLGCSAWLLIHPGRFNRALVPAASAGIGILIAPWYVHLAESLSTWRVTKDWLLVPSVASRSLAALTLPWTFVSPRSASWASHAGLEYAAIVVFVLLAVLASIKLRRRFFAKRRQLMWMCLFTACAGPFLFDRVMGTYTTAVPRYAIAGMPAALLLGALALGRLRPTLRVVFLLLIVVVWLPSSWTVLTNSIRSWEPFRQVASVLDAQAAGSDVVVVHSIPSGVLGIARYLEKPIPLFSWVGQLKVRRVPADIESLPRQGRIILVKIHAVGEPAPEEAWLRTHAILSQAVTVAGVEVLSFVRHDTLSSEAYLPLGQKCASKSASCMIGLHMRPCESAVQHHSPASRARAGYGYFI